MCKKYVHKHFGLSNTFKVLDLGVAFHGMDFTKRKHVAMWLNYQKSFYKIQPERDEVLIPWSFKAEVYIYYLDTGSVVASENTTDDFSPCHRLYFLLV